jgi:endonuclease YncB( thermonuclease family)
MAGTPNGPTIEKMKCDRAHPIGKTATVVNAADGDTINVQTKTGVYAIRMIGMDTPETHYFGHSQGKWGDAAAQRMEEILPAGTKVTLELSPSVCDTYGRVVAHVFKGEMHVNKEMVKEGLAVNYCLYPSVAHCAELGELARQAMEKRLGMFTDSNVELPYDYRRRISHRRETSYVGSLKTKEVYRPGNEERTPIPERIFFVNEHSIPSPFHLVD